MILRKNPLQNGLQPSRRHKDAALLLSTKATPHIDDEEFGRIAIRRHARARHIRLSMQPDGSVSVTLPPRAELYHAERMIDESRSTIRNWRAKHTASTPELHDCMRVGQSHTLSIQNTQLETPHTSLRGLTIQLLLPLGASLHDPAVKKVVFAGIKKALTKEARAFLPRRLAYLAAQHGFSYERTRFGAPKGRWGSCSSRGTISLNVSLMALDPELIDYVIIHELCHTREMNHSPRFWTLVESCLPDYKDRRKRLKTKTPMA